MNFRVFLFQICAFIFLLETQTVFCFDSIPDLSMERLSLGDEGFFWKTRLVVQKEVESLSFEQSHTHLYQQLKGFRHTLSSLEEETIVDEVSKIILHLPREKELKEVFLELNEDGQKISDVKDSDNIREEIFRNEQVKKIIKKNLTRLKSRNACMASLEYISEKNERKKIPVLLRGQPVIFLSGIGNELIRILQKTVFKNFQFIIFHRGETNEDTIGINKGKNNFRDTLENLYVNSSTMSNVPALTSRFKKEVFKLSELEKLAKEEEVNSCKAVRAYLADFSGLDVSNTLEEPILEMPKQIMRAKYSYLEAFKEFRAKFCDSEQALRYFLFAHIDTFLKETVLSDKGLLVLNIHSEMDPCKYCTNALSLECYLRDKKEFQVTDKKKRGLGGFFHKLHVQSPKTMPQAFIFVSSQGPESEGGMGRRLMTGGFLNSQVNDPIPREHLTRLFFKHNGPMGLHLKVPPMLPQQQESSTHAPQNMPAVDQEDLLNTYNFDNLIIPLNKKVSDLPFQRTFLKGVGKPQKFYLINEKTFNCQNVSGSHMRCFFNALGMDPMTQADVLKRKCNDPIVRYMIANEIVSAAANPEQLSKEVKEAIDYTTYINEREQLDRLENMRSEKLKTQNHNANMQDPSVLPSFLSSSGQEGDKILSQLRQRSLSLRSFNAFLESHIGGEEMMVALLDVQGDSPQNVNANYTSIDAVAYVNDLGIKIYQSAEKGLQPKLVHQFIPENATKVAYLFHEKTHFQVLLPLLSFAEVARK